MEKYTSILELKKMLEDNNIPFEFKESKFPCGYHLYYPRYGKIGKGLKCSVAEHEYSYGHADDLLEIMGLLTPEERKADVGDIFSVAGYLTTMDVFNRIKNHYLKNKD